VSRPKLSVLPGYKPHRAVVLGIDPATKSGYSIFVQGKLRSSGIVSSARARMSVIEEAVRFMSSSSMPLVVVVEDWSPGGWKSWKAIASVFESWGRWSEQLDLLGIKKVVRVQVDTWRRDLYGPQKMGRRGLKDLAKARVGSVYKKSVTHDEAEAILIGEWGCRAAEVSKLLA